MPWVSGQTIKPPSEEMTFWIGANATLPIAQAWEQLWTIYPGIPPNPKGAYSLSFNDNALRIVSEDYRHFMIRLAPDEGVFELAERSRSKPRHSVKSDDPWKPKHVKRTVMIKVGSFNLLCSDYVVVSSMTVSTITEEIAVRVRVRGRNPSISVVSSALSKDIMRAICWTESRWRQFNSMGTPLENQNSNGTSDWGICQINEASNLERWNWKLNVSRAIEIFAEKQQHAKAYLDRHKPYTNEMFENESIQRYNGGAYYRWDSTSQKWIAKPPNDYVRKIRSFLKTKPWNK